MSQALAQAMVPVLYLGVPLLFTNTKNNYKQILFARPLNTQSLFQWIIHCLNLNDLRVCIRNKGVCVIVFDDVVHPHSSLILDKIYYHCGNLPPKMRVGMLKMFFGESDVELDEVVIHRESVVHVEKTDIKKGSKKRFKKKTFKHHW